MNKNVEIAKTLLAGVGGGAEPTDIASAFSADLTFEIRGDTGVMPWIGVRRGREAVADFVRGTRQLVEHLRFDVDDVLASDARAVIVGSLASRIIKTGKTVETDFAIILTIADNVITRFQMLEDSFAVASAAR